MARGIVLFVLGLYFLLTMLVVPGIYVGIGGFRVWETPPLTLIGLVTLSGLPALFLIVVLLWVQWHVKLEQPSFMLYPLVPIGGAASLIMGGLGFPLYGAVLSTAVVIVCVFLALRSWRLLN